jgi:ketosteroid isomerase-like protein
LSPNPCPFAGGSRRHDLDFRQDAARFDEGTPHGLRTGHGRITKNHRDQYMMLRAYLVAVLAIPAVLPVSAAAAMHHESSPAAIAAELVEADRGFAKAAEGKPIIDGLLPMFDDESVMPAPSGFVKGSEAIKAALASNPLNAGAKVSWTPVRGGVSADGKHGFTIGFMDITAEGKPDRKAKYVSYWIKRPAGWRVAVYKRAPRIDGEISRDLMPPSLPEQPLKPATDAATLAAYKASLDKAERDFSDMSQKIGIGPAFVQNGRPDATNIGAGPGFTVGNDKIGEDVAKFNGPPIKWGPEDVIVSATGDFGITWGFIRPVTPPADGTPGGGPYTTIWRRAAPDQPWRYVAE